ncbi:MAG: hypothetical protein ACE145_09655 [Terriglobia bacterium]
MRRTIMLLSVLVLAGGSLLAGAERITKTREFHNVNLQQLFDLTAQVAKAQFASVKVKESQKRIQIFDKDRIVSHRVTIKQNHPGVSEVVDEARGYWAMTVRTKRGAVEESLEVFFEFLERALAATAKKSEPAKVQGLDALRKEMIGTNVRARIALPAWQAGDGTLAFPPGRTTKPNEVATITEIVLCSEYPAGEPKWGDESCGYEPKGDRTIVVFLLNGATIRKALGTPTIKSQNPFAGGASFLLWVDCAMGRLLSCTNAQFAEQRLAEEETRLEIARSRDELQRLEEVRNFRDSGPEVAIWLPADTSEPIKGETIREAVARFVAPVQ